MKNDYHDQPSGQPSQADVRTVMPLLLPTRKTAELLGVTIRTIYNWDELGHLPKPVKIGGSLCWRYEELLAWTEAGCPKRDDWQFKSKRQS